MQIFYRVKIAHNLQWWMMTPVREIGVCVKEAFLQGVPGCYFLKEWRMKKGKDALVLSVLSN